MWVKGSSEKYHFSQGFGPKIINLDFHSSDTWRLKNSNSEQYAGYLFFGEGGERKDLFFFFFKLACDSFLFVYLLIFFLKHLITIFLIFSVLFVKNRDSKYV